MTALTKVGAGTMTLSGANTYTGGTNIDAGTISIANIGALGTGRVTLNGGALRSTVTGTLTNLFTAVASSDSTISAATGQTLTLDGRFTVQTGNPTRTTLRFGTASDTGTVVLRSSQLDLNAGGLNDFDIVVQGGTLADASGGAAFLTNSANSTRVDSGAVLDFRGLRQRFNVQTATRNLIGTGTVRNDGGTTQLLGANFGGVLDGTQNLEIFAFGADPVILFGNNTYTGTTNILSGTLQIGNGGSTGTLGTGNITNSGTLIFNRTGTFSVPGTIGQTGGAATMVQGGTIVGANGANGVGVNADNDGNPGLPGQIALRANGGSLSLSGGAILQGGNGGNGSGATVAGSGGNAGAGLVAANLRIGLASGTAINGGNGGSGAGGVIAGSGGNGGDGIVGANLTIVNAGTIAGGDGGNAGATIVDGPVRGTPGFALNFTGALNSLTTNGGTLTGGINIASGATLTLDQRTVSGALGGASYANIISGAGDLVVTTDADKSVTLTGANTATGTTTVLAGTLNNNGGLGGALVVNGGTVNNAARVAGATTVTGGVLNLNTGTNLANTQVLTVNGGTVNVNAADIVAGLAGGTGGTINFSPIGLLTTSIPENTSTTFAGAFTGSTQTGRRYFLITDGGTLTLSGQNTTTGGATFNVFRGVLNLEGGNAIGDENGLEVDDRVNLRADETIGHLNLGDGIIDLGTHTLTLAGLQSGVLRPAETRVMTTGSGNLRLNASRLGQIFANTLGHTGTTQISAGIMQYGAADILADASSLVIDGGSLNMRSFSDTVGAVSLQSGQIAGSAGATLTSLTDFDVRSGNIDVVLAGSVGLTKTGPGGVALLRNNTYTGTTTISEGALQVGFSTFTGSLGTGNVVNNGALFFGRLGDHTVANVISGTGTLEQAGGGVLTLTGANTYSGGTTLTSGAIDLGNHRGLGTGRLTMAAGTSLITTDRAFPISNDILLLGDVVFNTPAGRNTLEGFISGTGGFRKTGGGELDLRGANAFIGSVNVEQGGLNVGQNTSLGDPGNVVSMSAGTILSIDSGVTVANDLVLSGLVFLRGEGGTSILSGDITGDAEIRTRSFVGGMLALTGTNTYTGPTTIEIGTLSIGNGGTTGTLGTGDVTNNSRLVFNRSNDFTVANNIGGIGNLLKRGTGTTTLNGANTYTGITRIEAGTLALGANDVLGDATAVEIAGGTLALGTFTDTVSRVTMTAGAITGGTGSALGLTGDYVQSGGTLAAGATVNVGTAGFVRLSGGTIAGTLNSARVNNFSGFVDNGAVTVTGTLALGAGNLRVGDLGTATLTISGGGDVSNARGIIGDDAGSNGTVIVTGAGSSWINSGDLTLGREANATGNLTIEAGATVSNASGIVGLFGSGTVLVTGTGSSWINSLSLVLGWEPNASGRLTVEAGATVRNDRATVGLSGSGTVIVTGTGSSWINSSDLVLGREANASGDLTIADGASISNAFAYVGRSGSGTVLVTGRGSVWDNSGQLLLGESSNSVGKLTIADGASVRNTAGAIGLAGSGTAFVTGAGSSWNNSDELQLGSGSSAVGSLTIADGASVGNTRGFIGGFGSGTVLVTGQGSLWTNSEALVIGQNNAGVGTLTIAEGGRVSSPLTVIGNLAGSTGTLVFGAGAGAAAVAAGTLDTPTIIFGAGTGEIVFNHTSTDFELAAAISGDGAITQIAGNTTLTGNSSGFAGTTTLTGGTLLVNGSLGGTITVTGGTLGGTGTLGNVTIGNGAFLNPGQSPGTMTTASLTLNAGSTTTFELGEAGVVGGLNNDLIVVTGNLTLNGGTIDVVRGTGFASGRYTLFQFDTLTGALGNLALNPLGGGFLSNLAVDGSAIVLDVATAADLVWWNGSTTTPTGRVEGGSGTWSIANNNFTNDIGTLSAPWAGNGSMAMFGGTAGTVRIAAGETLSPSSLGFVTDGYLIAGGDAASRLELAGATGIDTAIGVGATISAVISGNGSLTKTGDGTLTLTADNLYDGGTTILGGTLQVGNGGTSGTLGTGDVVNNGSLIFDRSDAFTVGNTITGTGSLTFTGGGTLTLTGDNLYQGGTTIRNSTLIAGNANALGTGSGAGTSAVDLEDAALVFDYSGIFGQTFGLDGTANTLAATSGSEVSLTGRFFDASLVRFGSATHDGTIVLAMGNPGSDNLDMDMAFDGGTVRVGSVGGLAYLSLATQRLGFSGRDTVLASGATIDLNGFSFGPSAAILGNIIGSGTIANSGGATSLEMRDTVSFTGTFDSGPNSLTILGKLKGDAAITKTGTGTLVFGSTLSTAEHTGGLVLREGTRSLQTGLAASFGSIRTTGSVIDYAGGIDIAAPIALDSGSTQLQVLTGAATQSGIISELGGARGFEKIGAGTLILTGNNTYTGTTTISAGTLQVGNGGTGGTLGSGDVVNNASLIFDRSDAFTVGNTISGTGSLAFAGTGTLTLTGNNRYSGTTTISSGTLAISAASNLGDGSATNGLVIDGGSLRTTSVGGFTMGRSITIGAAGGTIDTTGSLTLSGSVDFTGRLTKTGDRDLLLLQGNTGAGGIDLQAGSISIADDNALGTGTLTMASGTTLFAATFGLTLANNIVLAGGAGSIVSPALTTLTGVLSGGRLNVAGGSGPLTLTGANTYGETNIAALESLIIGNGGTTGTLGTGAVTNDGTLSFDRSNSLTVANVISGSGNLRQRGSGTTILTGNNSYTGTTTISAGTLQVGDGGTTGTLGTGNVTNNASLVFNRSDDLAVANVINGSGTLTKRGGGNLTLSGSNTYAGLTSIDAGTLTIANASALGSTAAGTVVADGATLALAGTMAVGEAITINGSGVGGNGALRSTGAGANQSLGGQITLGSASLIVADGASLEVRGGITGADFDLTIGGTGQVGISSAVTLGRGRLVKDGSGQLSLFSGNADASALIVNGGAVQLGFPGAAANGAIADTAAVVLNAGDLLIAASETIGSLSGAAGTTVADFNLGLTLTVGSDNTSTTFAGILEETLALTKIGTGTLTLTGASTSTGITRISGGTLEVAGGSLAGSVVNDATFVLDGRVGGTLTNNGTARIAGQIDGAVENLGSIAITAPTMILGRLTQGSAGTFDLAGFETSLGSLAGAGSIALGGGNLLLGSDDSSTTFEGVIAGNGQVLKSGAGILTLSGANSFTGLLTVNAGGLTLASGGVLAANLSSSASVVNDGTMRGAVRTSGSFVNNGSITGGVSNSGVFTNAGRVSGGFANTGSLTSTGTITGGLTQLGMSSATLSGTLGGGIENQGLITVNGDLVSDGQLNNRGVVIIEAGTRWSGLSGIDNIAARADALTVAGTLATGGTFANRAGATATIASTGRLEASLLDNAGTVRSAGTIIAAVNNTGTLESSGTITGNLLNQGTARLSGTMVGAVGNTGSLVLTGTTTGIGALSQSASGSFDLGGFGTAIGSLAGSGTVTLGAGTLTLGSDNSSTAFGGSIAGSGGITKLGSGTFTLAGVQSFTGTTLVQGGTLAIAGEIAGPVVNNADLALDGRIIGTLTNNGTARILGEVAGSVQNAGRITLLGNTLFGGAFNQTASGSLALAGFSSTMGSLSGAGAIDLGAGMLTVGRSNASTSFAGVISGTGNLVKTGTGTFTLMGANTYTGTTLIDAGVLAISGSIAGPVINNAGLINTGTIGGSVRNAAGATADNRGTIRGAAINEGRFTSTGVLGAGLANSGDASIAGVLNGDVINAGTIRLTGATAGIGVLDQAATGSFDLAGFNLRLGVLQGAGRVTLGSATLTTGTDGIASQFAGVISGSGALAKVGSGRLVLTGDNTFTGGTTISAGVLQLGNGGTSGSVLGPIVNNGALVINRSDAFTLGNPVSGSGMLVQDGTGTTTLTAANTYSGGTLISRGRLVGNTASLQGIIQNNAALEFAQGTAGVFVGRIGGTGLFDKTGAGLLDLTGDNSAFSGRTVVRGGELRVTGALNNSAVTVQSGAVLSGTGVMGGLVAESGSTIAPGAGGVGMLGVAGGIQLRSGSTTSFQIRANAPSDMILATGNAQLGGTAAFSNLGGVYAFNSDVVLMQADGGRTGTFDATSGFADSASSIARSWSIPPTASCCALRPTSCRTSSAIPLSRPTSVRSSTGSMAR